VTAQALAGVGARISVVTPTFNRVRLLPRLWHSIREQPVAFEWLVIDDGSTEDVAQVVSGFADPRVAYVRRDVNSGGPAAARNAGALLARAPFVVFVDDDDELLPGVLARMVAVMEQTDAGIGGALFQCLLPGGRRWRERVVNGAVYGEHDVVCGRVLGSDKIIVYRREVFQEFLLPEDLGFAEAVFVYALTRRYRLLMTDEPGLRVHASGDRASDARRVVARSRSLAIAYERISDNHREVLATCAPARLSYRLRAQYRYAVAGDATNAFRLLREVAADTGVAGLLQAGAIALLAGFHLGPLVERVRLPLVLRHRTMRERWSAYA
jgi:glycosyltransferase involved in cell wall biosynthesis